jgi:uncharacterized protein YndB with AHSA1/START domain
MATANRMNSTVISTPSDRELALTRVFDAPRRLVWEVSTKPEHLTKWMLGPEGWTMPICESDFREGGKWRFVWRNAKGSEMSMHGVYQEIVAPERFVTTENWGPEWPETINTISFAEEDGRTRMTGTIRYVSTEARDAAMKSGMTDGANISYDRLDDLLASLQA